jgi:ribose-phosphate pyrophosphokinase
MIDTAGTIIKASEVLLAMGAASVIPIATHPVLSGPAYDRISASYLKQIVVTDTIPLRKDADTSKIKVLSTAPMLADVINKVYNNESIASHFIV